MVSMWIFLGLLLAGVTRAQESQCGGPMLGDPRGTEERWTYDQSKDVCTTILLNKPTDGINVFKTEKDCLSNCSQVYRSLNPTEDAVCDLPQDPGPCMALIVMWYYDKERKICDTFFYGGCRGNGNRFVEWNDCTKVCALKKGKSGAASGSEPSDSGTDAGLIIGIVFGVIFGAAFLVTLALYLVQRKKLKRQEHKRVPDTEMK